jgi:hypothetical protein
MMLKKKAFEDIAFRVSAVWNSKTLDLAVKLQSLTYGGIGDHQ